MLHLTTSPTRGVPLKRVILIIHLSPLFIVNDDCENLRHMAIFLYLHGVFLLRNLELRSRFPRLLSAHSLTNVRR